MYYTFPVSVIHPFRFGTKNYETHIGTAKTDEESVGVAYRLLDSIKGTDIIEVRRCEYEDDGTLFRICTNWHRILKNGQFVPEGVSIEELDLIFKIA